MNYRCDGFEKRWVMVALSALVGAACLGCASAGPEVEASGTASSALTCGGTVGGSYAALASYYTYAPQTLDIDCAAAGAVITVFVSANDVPNRFTIRDAGNNAVSSSQWLGSAAYSGPWGSTLSNGGTASLSFSKTSAPYTITVETLTPPDGSYPHTTDVWSASSSCQCAPPQLRHYTCGFAMEGYNCDNGRSHSDITAVDMSAAIATCQSTGLPGYPDFCYVVDRDGASNVDANECAAASASWRPGNNCCNFKGTKSCPF